VVSKVTSSDVRFMIRSSSSANSHTQVLRAAIAAGVRRAEGRLPVVPAGRYLADASWALPQMRD
jgi:hypothetical protein